MRKFVKRALVLALALVMSMGVVACKKTSDDPQTLEYYCWTAGYGTSWVEKQMEDFMAVCRSEGATYLDTEIDLRKGDRVRILGGPLAGVEGIYTKTTLKHERRVVVRIEGVAAVATLALPASEVEKI